MPAATDHTLAVEQQLWALLLAAADVAAAVRPGNRIRFDDLAKRWPENKPPARGPADFLSLKIEPTGFQENENLMPTLGNTTGTTCPRRVQRVQRFAFTITGADRTINAVGQAAADVLAAIRAAGQTLGLPGVVYAVNGVQGGFQATSKPDAAGGTNQPAAKYAQVRFELAVTIRFNA